jgi:glyoxylase-like metal-dependent hydrolase (beta-lactamase superfamily II)
MTAVPCFGHAPDLHALVFCSISGESVWVVGDAILDLTWLIAWKYYWPNLYNSHEIIQTWESVARILSRAEVVIPGHGGFITITATLIEELLATFPRAEYAEKCRDVESLLGERLHQLRAENSN